MTKENKFRRGNVAQTLGYLANGNSDDYMYGEQAEKDKIYCFTPEVGPRFWPSPGEIDELNKEVLESLRVTGT